MTLAFKFLSILFFWFISGGLTGLSQTKWWNSQWGFRSSIPGSIQPVLGNICAAKVNFTALLEKVLPGGGKLDTGSLRVIGAGKDGTLSEMRFNFIPHPNFNPDNNARGTIVWEKGEDIERYHVYFDVSGLKEKPVSSFKTEMDINLLSGGDFRDGIGKFKTFGDVVFDEDNGFSGKGSVKLRKKKDAVKASYIFSPFLNAEPEKTYDVIIFARSDAEKSNNFALVAYVNYYDENNRFIDRAGSKLETRAKFDWIPCTMSVKSHEKTKKIALHVETYQETGYVWVDDIRITPAVNYVIDNVEDLSGKTQSVADARIPFDFVEIKYPDFYRQEAEIEPEEQRIGYYLWESRPEIKIYPYTKAPVVRKRQVKAWGTPGERITRSVCIRPFAEMEKIQMEITGDLKNIIEIREMKYLARKRQRLGKTYHIVPSYLDSISGRIEKGMTSQYYLTFQIPENGKPGVYSGNLLITTRKAGKDISFSMPISLRILPFKLFKPEDVFWGLFYGNYDWNTVYRAGKERKVFYPEQEQLMFENMIRHNANMLGLSGCTPVYEKRNGVYLFDFTKVVAGRGNVSLKEALDNAARAGFRCVLLGLPNDVNSKYFDVPFMSEKWQNLYVQLIQDTLDFVEKQKYPFRVYFLIVDEPANSQKLTDDAIKLCGLARSRIKNVRIFETLHTQTIHRIGPLVDACMMYAEQINEKIIETISNMGKELWSYNGGSFGRDYRVDRFYTGFYMYKTGIKAIGQWVYMWSKGPDAYDDFNPGNRGNRHAGDYYALPSQEGPKDTPGWEGFCDGIYDYMYLYTLEKTVEKIKKTGSREKIKEAETVLEEIKKEILDTIPVEYSRDFVNTEDFQPDVMDAWRWKIAQKIMLLENLL